MLRELLGKLQMSDPVGDGWVARSRRRRLWCDASSLAIGCALEIEGNIVEDAAWVRKKGNGAHINMAQLDSMIKGLSGT